MSAPRVWQVFLYGMAAHLTGLWGCHVMVQPRRDGGRQLLRIVVQREVAGQKEMPVIAEFDVEV
jgi:hypothetical protein